MKIPEEVFWVRGDYSRIAGELQMLETVNSL